MQDKKIHISSEKVVTVSFFVDISDVLINLLVAIVSGSVVMFSQALEGGAGLLASGLLIFGIKKSKKPSDRKHPFGYGREIYFWTFLSALVTFTITAGVSFYLGLERFLDPQPIHNVNLVIVVLLISILTNGYAMSLSFRRLLGKKVYKNIINIFLHSAFIATKTAFVLDLMGTLASLLGLISISLYKISGNQKLDGLGAMLIGITLAILAIYILKSAKDLLVGQSASPETEDKIKSTVEALSEVKKVISLRTLQIGAEILLVDIEVNLQDNLTTDKIEILIDRIQADIVRQVPEAKEVRVELETPEVKVLLK
ncbi:cation diffusion facilitator family transporter [Patescibacteria group bacterium]|nr:cation diffusion facilitator family transporter [Patescibacteria group bacterium]